MKSKKKQKKANFISTVRCPNCGSKKFRQQIVEIYNRYLDECGISFEYEDNMTHDLEFGIIRCIKCWHNCDNLFENIEIKVPLP